MKKLTLFLLGALLMPLFFTKAQAEQTESAHDFSFVSIEGELSPLSQYKGKVLLVVNTASQCGFTKQYSDLQKLYDTYKERGLVVLGVPSNDFGGQEPGSDSQIKEFCNVNFDIDFPVTGKSVVSGAQAHPFYEWAAAQVTSLGRPRWNFHKYLIGEDGKLVDWFSSMTNPMDDKVKTAIERILPPESAAQSSATPLAQ
jgi:glutathione peroxidase